MLLGASWSPPTVMTWGIDKYILNGNTEMVELIITIQLKGDKSWRSIFHQVDSEYNAFYMIARDHYPRILRRLDNDMFEVVKSLLNSEKPIGLEDRDEDVGCIGRS